MTRERLMLQVRRDFNPLSKNISFYMAFRRSNSLFVAQSLKFKESPDNIDYGPAFKLSVDEAQNLMDELWVVGLRPSEGTGSAGSLAATQKHLEDMRKIAFKRLNMETPQ